MRKIVREDMHAIRVLDSEQNERVESERECVIGNFSKNKNKKK